MKLFTFLFILLLCPVYKAQTDTSGYQLLWEISGKNLKKPSFLFGSMHSNDPRLFQFPDTLYRAFHNADAVVLETDVSALFDEYDVRLNLFHLDIFDKNRTYTASREATNTVYGSEDGRPQFLDAFFQQSGVCGGKSFFPLESFAEQMAAADKIGKMSARSAINNYFFSEERFTETYIQGDIVALNKMLKAQLNGMPGAYEALVTERNVKMAKGLDTLMQKRSVFCVIGSAHLYGNEGVIQLLRKQGYTLRRVQNSHVNSCAKEAKVIASWRKFPVSSVPFGFEVTLSGKPVITETPTGYHFIYQELGQGNTYELFIEPSPQTLNDIEDSFVSTNETKKRTVKITENVNALEGLVKNQTHGYQWKRIFFIDGYKYEMIAFGGNKFMHSDRPVHFFNQFIYTF